MLQHWGEHGRVGEPIRFWQPILEYACGALSLLFVVGQIWYLASLL